MTLEELNEIKANYKVVEIAVDFINPSYNISRAKHLDTARYLLCTLTENGIPRKVKTNEVARIRLQKPDRTYVYNDCDIIEDGRVLITLTEQILAVEGNAVCDIQLTDEETGIIYSTKNFIINVDKTAVDNSVIESSYEFDALNNLISTNKKINGWLEADEEVRKVNENKRIDNENTRITQELKRQEDSSLAVYNAEKAANEATLATENCKEITSQAEDALQNQIQLNETLDIATQIKNDVTNMQSSVLDVKLQVEKDKEEIDDTIKNSLLASSEKILATVKDYFDRAQQLYNSMYIDCDGETPQQRVVTIVSIDCGTPQSRLYDTNGILFNGGTPLNRQLAS